MALTKVGANKSKRTGSAFIGGAGIGKSEKSQSSKVRSSGGVSFRDAIVAGAGETTSSYSVEILQADGSIDEAILAKLQDAIHSTGEMLVEKPGYNTVRDYRRAVQTLLKSVLPYLHYKENVMAPQRFGQEMRSRKFTLVNQVNEKLDIVLKLVLSSQVEQMHIMQRLDEIKGLIINILQ